MYDTIQWNTDAPQPQSSIYTINNSSEISNIPIGNYLSAGICLNEGVLYLKTLQNGVPMMLGYKLSSLEGRGAAAPTPQNSNLEDYEKKTYSHRRISEKIKERR